MVLLWTPQFLYQDSGERWKMKSSKGTAQSPLHLWVSLSSLRFYTIPWSSINYMLLAFASSARQTSDDCKDIHMDARRVTLIALPPIQSYGKKKVTTNEYFFLYYFDSL
jgi:hypothetical protein